MKIFYENVVQIRLLLVFSPAPISRCELPIFFFKDLSILTNLWCMLNWSFNMVFFYIFTFNFFTFIVFMFMLWHSLFCHTPVYLSCAYLCITLSVFCLVPWSTLSLCLSHEMSTNQIAHKQRWLMASWWFRSNSHINYHNSHTWLGRGLWATEK